MIQQGKCLSDNLGSEQQNSLGSAHCSVTHGKATHILAFFSCSLPPHYTVYCCVGYALVTA